MFISITFVQIQWVRIYKVQKLCQPFCNKKLNMRCFSSPPRFIHIHLNKNIFVRLGYITWPKLGYACAIRMDIRWRARDYFTGQPAGHPLWFCSAETILSFDNSVRLRVLRPNLAWHQLLSPSAVCKIVSNIQNHLLI